MPYLLELAVDNSRRLTRKSYLLEYGGLRFKLVQDSPRRWADHLLTVVSSYSEEQRNASFQVASELISAIAWSGGARMTIWEAGGRSWYEGKRLSQAQPSIRVFPRIPFGGLTVGATVVDIPKIETEEQRIALTLFREARAANSDFLSFLFFWQVLETGGTNAEKFANKCHRELPRDLAWRKEDLKRLPLRGKKLGEFLRDEGRDAIAHIRRKAGKKKLELDSASERRVFADSVLVAEALAKHYISNHLGLNQSLYLMRRGSSGFPRFITAEEASSGRWQLAYPR